ncbi:cyanidin 3-O-rutinoside 5-O-glucosyltransferase-like [Oryza brachyantha]|uniref:cyanidin 3-O-rutinoside 5-O-glucosyltransferase-like n=1 Tax=Oryza brachyantha TaxID=4533 RepID=UPI001ADC7F43|nr:cyanidin 3-O-rutinoside 5-O-glucosyltransferase-like [Oryza brachyantha]
MQAAIYTVLAGHRVVALERPAPAMARQHFLVVAYPAQGHINPARALAARLARVTGADVTLSAAVSAHRRMFPSLAAPDEEARDDGAGVSYVPYSDGYDEGFRLFDGDGEAAWRNVDSFDRVGRETFAAVVDRLAARGRPVTCVVYAFLMWWAADVARERGIPRVLYWIQPATMLAVYYHYLHGYESLVTEHAGEPEFTVSMPGLPPMAIRDLPTFFIDLDDAWLAAAFNGVKKTIRQVDIDRSSGGVAGAKPMVLVNTVEELELDLLASFPELDILPIGPVVTSLDGGKVSKASHDLYKHDEKGYMEWLDAKPAESVVYVSFGSMSAVSKRQKDEIRRGLAATGRPYLWVVREDNRDDGDGDEPAPHDGMVVGWCDQVRVLSHPAVGCFVTHCGWNSTLEAVACGTPVVAAPQWSDQDTNALLVAGWGVGVRAATAADRVLEADELARCVEAVMSDTAAAFRRSSAAWKAKVQGAVAEGGSSGRNLKSFLDRIANVAHNTSTQRSSGVMS